VRQDRKLRFGVLGAGAFAEACHVPGLQSHPQAEVVVVCGRRRERVEALAGRLGIPEFATDPAEVCARPDLDGVTICTPNDSHRGLALLAFAHGKHVFCEKPLGISVVEAEAMAAAAVASRRTHQVAFTYRYLYGVEELRRRVAAGDVGEPFLFRAQHDYWDGLRPEAKIGWRELQAPSGGGTLYDLGSHLFDLARYCLGPIEAVKGAVQHLPRTMREPSGEAMRPVETDDRAACWLRFVSGAQGDWSASRITPARGPNYVQVVGRDGALEAYLSRGRIDGLRVARAGSATWDDVPLPEAASDGESHALTRMMCSFVDACLTGAMGENDATFADGLAVQRALAAVERSAAAGWVPIDPPT
jgi:predicted dehydrogenase